MKKYHVRFLWRLEIIGKSGIYGMGNSVYVVETDNIVSAINKTVDYARNIPLDEIKDNGIKVDGNNYRTSIENIVRVTILSGERK